MKGNFPPLNSSGRPLNLGVGDEVMSPPFTPFPKRTKPDRGATVCFNPRPFMAYTTCTPPTGDKITISNGKLSVPNHPIIPFIRGDGTGPDIWASSVRVLDAAVEKACGYALKKISWFEVFAGEASKTKFNNWLPDDTVEAFQDYLVGIKGPQLRPWAAASVRSMSPCARCSTSTSACARCSTSAACPRP